MGIADKIQELEVAFSGNQYNGTNANSLFISEGSIPVLVSAPHAVNHFREGKTKWADMYTGAIAGYIREKTGCHLICNTGFSEHDPNYDEFEDNLYQQTLAEYVKEHNIELVIDLHGAAASREFGVEIGTADDNERVTNELKEIFAKTLREDKNIATRHLYKWNTVAKGIHDNTGIETVQLEINKRYRDPEQIKNLENILSALTEFVEKEAERIMAEQTKDKEEEIMAIYTRADFDKPQLNENARDIWVQSDRFAFDKEGILYEKKTGRPVVWEGLTDGDFIPWTVDEFVKECSWHGLDSSRLTDDYKEKAAQRECEDLINSFAGSPNIPKDDISRFYASVEYISYDNHYPYVEQYDVLRGWIDGYNTAKNREKPLSDKIKASEYKFDKDFYGLKKQEKAGKEYVSENRYTCIDDGDRYKEGFRAGYGGTIKEMYLARDEAVLGCNLAQEPEEPSKENASQESFEQLLSQSLAKELKEAKARIAELEAENKTPAKDNFKEKTMWNKSQPYDFGKDEIGQEALDNYFGDIPEDVADYAETEEANKTGFKDGYKAAMERMLGENQKLREQLEQAQQKATSLDALNYAIENHPNERLAETVSKNAAEMIKWANYTMEHGHVQPKSIDTKDIVILPIEPGKYKPGQAKETLLSDFKLDGLKEVASTLEERYALFNGRQMCAVACEPTAEGIVTYMSAVKEIFDKNPEYSAGSPIPRIVHDARTLINDDIEAVQQIADGIEMNRFLKEQEAKQNEHEKNIEKDVVQKDENNKDVGAAIGED